MLFNVDVEEYNDKLLPMIDLSNKKIVVTGGSGFIGSNFIEYVDKMFKGVTIFNVDKGGHGSRNMEHILIDTHGGFCEHKSFPTKNGNFYYHSSGPLGGWTRFDLHGYSGVIDYVFHFAAESHVDRSISSPYEFIQNNIDATTDILEYVRLKQPSARIICVSTDEVYGHLGLNDEPFTENSPVAPRSPYAASKASSDLIALSYHETYGLDVIVTRCCNNYGPWQYSEKFIPTIIRSLREGKKIPVYGNGQNVREWIHVDDHNKSLLEICEQGVSGGVYNIGSGLEYNNLDMIEMIIQNVLEETTGWERHCEFVTDRQGHDFRYAIDSVNYVRKFQLKPFHEGLPETVNFYNKN